MALSNASYPGSNAEECVGMSAMQKNFLYLLIGGGIGATLGLLFAPKAGADLRQDLSQITRTGYDDTLELAHQLKEQSAELYNSMKEKADHVYGVAVEKLSLSQDVISDAADRVSSEVLELGKKQTGTGKSSPDITH